MREVHNIIKHILLTEKGTALTEQQNKYMFKVDRSANKMEIKQAVEKLFGVHVVKVNAMNRQGKMKRGRSWRYGRTANWKKAVVTLKANESIDLA